MSSFDCGPCRLYRLVLILRAGPSSGLRASKRTRQFPGPHAHLPRGRLWKRSLWPIGGASAQPQTSQEPSGPARVRIFSHRPTTGTRVGAQIRALSHSLHHAPAPLRDVRPNPRASAEPPPTPTAPAELRRCAGNILHFCIQVCMHTRAGELQGISALISWLQSPSAVILEPRKIKSDTVSTVSSVSWDVPAHPLYTPLCPLQTKYS